MRNSWIRCVRSRSFLYLLLLGTLVAVVTAIAQTDTAVQKHQIVIDGTVEPDRIPDWILWNEIFRRASLYSSKTATNGQDIWVDKLHFSKGAMDSIMEAGLENDSIHLAAENEAVAIATDARRQPQPDKEAAKVKLHKTQRAMEAQTLELRDKLRARIGEDAFLRLQSYARLQIAPHIKVGVY